ncbi:hypothetical protein B296_00048157 [Ensete ventricosum]|uniref:Uncharacterized protein n=1 Tax=Ensete ventricosum TaxID=4639 RepID=A0A426X9U8_ENSVE|nr:hypothetical protein B296_00048157 [Ensete ventricosum]
MVGSCGCGRGMEMVMAALQRAILEQRWQREITTVKATSIVHAAMLIATEGKKGNGNVKMAVTGKKQH